MPGDDVRNPSQNQRVVIKFLDLITSMTTGYNFYLTTICIDKIFFSITFDLLIKS